MSVYNEPLKWLNQSIDSVLEQTFQNFELILINDNPRDLNLFNFLNDKKKQSDKILLINNKINRGLTKSLIKGVQTASGSYIARMDADDISLSNRLEIQYEYLTKNKQFYLIGTGKYNIDNKGNILQIIHPLTREDRLKKKLLTQNVICHSSIFFRNDKRITYRDKFVYAQDYDFYLQLLHAGKRITNISNILVKYRINQNAITFMNKAKQKLFAEKAKEFYFQRQANGIDDYDLFNPNEILDIDTEISNNKLVLKEEIINNFLFSNFVKVRMYCMRYFKRYGLLNQATIYYLLSYCGNNLINLLRKTNLFDQVSTRQLKK